MDLTSWHFWGLALFVTIGMVVMFHGIWNLNRGYRSRSWPRVPGRITKVTSEEDESEATGYDHRVIVDYEFLARHQKLQAREYFPRQSGPGMSAEAAKRLRSHYAVGQEVEVAWDPENFPDSTINPGGMQEGWPGVLVGAVFTAIAIYIFWHSR